MARSRNLQKWREWRRRMARFAKSRQSVAEFCRQEGLSAPSFYQWRKRLADWPPGGHRATADAAGSFRPVRLVAAGNVAVHLPGGTQLQVPTSDPQTLRRVLGVLVHADARRAGEAPC